MSKNKNPLAGIVKFYEKCVKEQDEKGFAETYKQATDLLFERIKKEISLDLHFEDISYGDGYFIFGYGTNSVVNFHIKEAPGWLGGIWWSPIATEETKDKKTKTYETNKLSCALFFQYEEEIDKFKPSASMFGGDYFDFYFEDGYSQSNFLHACWDLRFIINEPYLAFYKEMHYSNFNHEYVSRESAKRYWNRHWKEKAKEKEIDKTNAKAMYETVKFIIGPMVKAGDAFILDEGGNISPRYEIFVKNITLNDGKPLVDEEGCYGLFDFDYPDKKSDKKLWKKTEKECAKREGYNFYFNNPFHCSCIIRNTKAFNKILTEAITNNYLLYGKLPDGTVFDGEIKSRFEE